MIVLDTSSIIDFIKGDKRLAETVESAEKRGEAIIGAISLQGDHQSVAGYPFFIVPRSITTAIRAKLATTLKPNAGDKKTMRNPIKELETKSPIPLTV